MKVNLFESMHLFLKTDFEISSLLLLAFWFRWATWNITRNTYIHIFVLAFNVAGLLVIEAKAYQQTLQRCI